ncbi:MAG: hypothetical protein JXX14_13400 [Deltaproteobacteria bacterium]|nr:hypothetical protein [Deltaproteobacteria bacterium]
MIPSNDDFKFGFFIRPVLCLLTLLSLSCAGSGGQVVERMPGTVQRPEWADPEIVWKRDDQSVYLIGCAVIDGKQEVTTGEPMAVSFAKEALATFLNTQVVSQLANVMPSNEATVFAERIQTELNALIDNTKITARYWERIKSKNGEENHIYIRIDLEKRTIKGLLEKVVSGTNDISTPLVDVFDAVDTGWTNLANTEVRSEVAALAQADSKDSNRKEKMPFDGAAVVAPQMAIKADDKEYPDTGGKCESTLEEYEKVTGCRYADFEKRRNLLNKAIGQCEGIDDSNIVRMDRLTSLLIQPTRKFTGASRSQMNSNATKFLMGSDEWFNSIEYKPSLSERILIVHNMFEAARDPLFLSEELQKQDPDAKKIKAALKRLTRVPLADGPTIETHYLNPHSVITLLLESTVPYIDEYGTWLEKEVQKNAITCLPGLGPGADVLKYIAQKGPLDDKVWDAGIEMIKRSGQFATACHRVMFDSRMDSKTRQRRLDDIAKMIVTGTLSTKKGLTVARQFTGLVTVLPPKEGLDVFLKWRDAIDTSDRGYKILVGKLLEALSRLDSSNPVALLEWCQTGSRYIQKLQSAVEPNMVHHDSKTFCSCASHDFILVLSDFAKDGILGPAEESVVNFAIDKAPGEADNCINFVKTTTIDESKKQQLKARAGRH